MKRHYGKGADMRCSNLKRLNIDDLAQTLPTPMNNSSGVIIEGVAIPSARDVKMVRTRPHDEVARRR